MFTALIVILVFSTVVVIHELGHYLACKAVGVRVERFAIGFGAEIFGFNWLGTRWSFCLLPLGGYVKPAGEELSDEHPAAPDEYFGKTWYQRIFIALAGPVMNYVLAVVCFFALLFVWGQAIPSENPVIGEVIAGYPAQASGLQAGDTITAINGQVISNWKQASQQIHDSPELAIDMEISRVEDGQTIKKIVAIVPKKDEQRQVGLIGISPSFTMEKVPFVQSWKMAGQQTAFWTMLTLRYLGNAIVKHKKPELAGPIGIVSMVAKVSKQGFHELLGLIAMISLSLGLFNFFPIPLLDGGHVFLYFLEGLWRKPLNTKFVTVANIAGAVVLAAIFLFSTTQDILRLKLPFLK